MELKKKIEHYTHSITDENENEWKVIETSDLEDIMESYHQAKLKNFDLAVVSQRSELLKAYAEYHMKYRDSSYVDPFNVDKYLESL